MVELLLLLALAAVSRTATASLNKEIVFPTEGYAEAALNAAGVTQYKCPNLGCYDECPETVAFPGCTAHTVQTGPWNHWCDVVAFEDFWAGDTYYTNYNVASNPVIGTTTGELVLYCKSVPDPQGGGGDVVVVTQFELTNFRDAFAGALPAAFGEAVAQMVHLKHLKLNDNDITTIPTDWSGLTALQTLKLHNTQLECVPRVRDYAPLWSSWHTDYFTAPFDANENGVCKGHNVDKFYPTYGHAADAFAAAGVTKFVCDHTNNCLAGCRNSTVLACEYHTERAAGCQYKYSVNGTAYYLNYDVPSNGEIDGTVGAASVACTDVPAVGGGVEIVVIRFSLYYFYGAIAGSLSPAFGEAVARMEHLVILDLEGNNITAIPADLSGLANLDKLYLWGNRALECVPRVRDDAPAWVTERTAFSARQEAIDAGVCPEAAPCSLGGNMYYAKGYITPGVIQAHECFTGGVNGHDDCFTGLECGNQQYNGYIEKLIEFTNEEDTEEECRKAAACALGDSPEYDPATLKFSFANMDKAPTGCIYKYTSNHLLFNKSGKGRGTAAGFRHICRVETTTSENSDTDFPALDFAHTVKDKCPTGQLIESKDPQITLNECRLAATALGYSNGGKDTQYLSRRKAPPGCVVRLSTMRFFYNKDMRGQKNSDYVAICRTNEHRASSNGMYSWKKE